MTPAEKAAYDKAMEACRLLSVACSATGSAVMGVGHAREALRLHALAQPKPEPDPAEMAARQLEARFLISSSSYDMRFIVEVIRQAYAPILAAHEQERARWEQVVKAHLFHPVGGCTENCRAQMRRAFGLDREHGGG